jgi:hypothetical protein
MTDNRISYQNKNFFWAGFNVLDRKRTPLQVRRFQPRLRLPRDTSAQNRPEAGQLS